MKINKKKLNEDIIDDLLKDPDIQEIDADDDKDEIEQALDECLETALMQGNSGDWPAIAIRGLAGSGKTAIVKQWCKANNIIPLQIFAPNLDPTDVGGIPTVITDKNGKPTGEFQYATSTLLKPLMKLPASGVPNRVLFLDEFNRASNEVQSVFLTIIQEHIVPKAPVPDEDGNYADDPGSVYLENFLFTIVNINPTSGSYTTGKFDAAMEDRFMTMDYVGEKEKFLKHVVKDRLAKLREMMDKFPDRPDRALRVARQIALIKHLVSHPDFKFDDEMKQDASRKQGNAKSLSRRSLKQLLIASDGTKEDFLRKWNRVCNSLDYPMAEKILNDYKDIEDKANDALKYKDGKGLAPEDGDGEEEENPFEEEENMLERISKQFPDLDIAGI